MASQSYDIIFEGFIHKESVYLKKLRKRWMVLIQKYLYCYKNKQIYNDPTEIFDLTIFDQVEESSDNDNNCKAFQLISTEQKVKRRFIVDSNNDMVEWIKYIKQIQEKVNDENDQKDDKPNDVVNAYQNYTGMY